MEHPSYSRYFAPNDISLFPKTKFALKERRFQDIEGIKKVTTSLKAIRQEQFQKCFQQWQHLWTKRISKVTPLSKP
jgi:hypothetical protein